MRPLMWIGRRRMIGLAVLALWICAGCGRVDPRWSRHRLKPEEHLSPAIEGLRAEVEKDQNSSEAHVRLATEYLRRDYLSAAADEFHVALEADPQNMNALLGFWQVQARLNDTANLFELAQRIERINPQDPRAEALLQEAARAFDDALATRPQDPWILINAAFCQAKMKHWDQAENYTRRAAAAVPNALTPWLMLGTLYLDQGLVARADDEFSRLAAQQPENALVHEALGRTRQAQGRSQDALTEFNLSQRLRPNWQTPYLDAGDACLQLGQCGNAEQYYRKGQQVSPRSLRAGLGVVQALSCQEKFDRAIAACEQLRADFPDNPEVINNLAYLYAETDQKLDLALELANGLLDRYANNGVIQDTAGWVLYRRGQYADALAHLQLARQLAPANSGIAFHLGKVLLALGRRAEASDAFRLALSGALPAREAAEAQEAAGKL
jgi:tetratricopeptide (TPR) repeat protein